MQSRFYQVDGGIADQDNKIAQSSGLAGFNSATRIQKVSGCVAKYWGDNSPLFY